MADFIPTVCGDTTLHAPTEGCSDCEQLEERVRALEECCANAMQSLDDLERRVSNLEVCCEDVQDALNTKLEKQDIVAGDNITIEYGTGNQILISSTGGGGGCTVTREQILACLGARELEMTIEDTNGNSEDWYVLGRLTSESPGSGPISGCECTKQQILNILGYREVDVSLTDTNGNRKEWIFIGRPKT